MQVPEQSFLPKPCLPPKGVWEGVLPTAGWGPLSWSGAPCALTVSLRADLPLSPGDAITHMFTAHSACAGHCAGHQGGCWGFSSSLPTSATSRTTLSVYNIFLT